jgi:hypothetical protein
MHVSAVCASVESVLSHGDGKNKYFGLNKGGVHAENNGKIARVDVLEGVALSKSSLVKSVSDPNFAHEGEPLVDLIVNVLESYLVILLLDKLECASVDESVNVALRPILVEGKGVIFALEFELCEIGSVCGIKNGRTLKIGVDAKLSLVNERNEDVFAAMCKRYNVSAESGASKCLPVAVLNRYGVFDIH